LLTKNKHGVSKKIWFIDIQNGATLLVRLKGCASIAKSIWVFLPYCGCRATINGGSKPTYEKRYYPMFE